MRDESPARWLARFREIYGPVHKAFAALDTDGQQALGRDLLTLLDRFNTADGCSAIAVYELRPLVRGSSSSQ